jgi:hypothetical protein
MTAPAIIPRIAKVMDIPEAKQISEEIAALFQAQPEEGQPGGGAPGQQIPLPLGQ